MIIVCYIGGEISHRSRARLSRFSFSNSHRLLHSSACILSAYIADVDEKK